MNFFPLCTAMVWPTISGMTVDRRDQVLMTFFSPPRFMTSTFSRSGTSTNGPFFSDLLISVASNKLPTPAARSLSSASLTRGYSHALLRSPLHDEPIGRLPVPRLVSLRRLTPWRHRMPAARSLALATTERMVDRIHRHAADVRPLPEPPAAARLADRDVLVIDVADLSD